MPDRITLIINHLTQARANSPTYGKTGEDFKITCRTYASDLETFELDVIESAFNEWRSENREFPHVSDIKKICARIQSQRYRFAQNDEDRKLQIEGRGKVVTDEDKAIVTKMMEGHHARVKEIAAEKKTARKTEPKYNPDRHWNRMSDDVKAASLARLRESARKTKR